MSRRRGTSERNAVWDRAKEHILQVFFFVFFSICVFVVVGLLIAVVVYGGLSWVAIINCLLLHLLISHMLSRRMRQKKGPDRRERWYFTKVPAMAGTVPGGTSIRLLTALHTAHTSKVCEHMRWTRHVHLIALSPRFDIRSVMHTIAKAHSHVKFAIYSHKIR